MKIIDRIAICTICCPVALTLVLSVGCDSAAERREEVSATIESVNHDLWQSTASTTDPSDADRAKAQQSLKSLLTKLRDTEGASSGQKAEASLLSSSINRKLAMMARAEADKIESDQSQRRSIISSLVSVAADLEAVASGIEGISTYQEKAHLATARQQAEQQIERYSEDMTSADGPINALTSANQRDQSEIDTLREQATLLMRESTELGPAAGFSSYEQAVQVERNADMIDYEVAHRDLEMEFTHQPKHALAKNKTQLTQSVITAIDESKNNVKGLEQTLEDEMTATRSKIKELNDTISSLLNELHEVRVGALNDAYEQAGKLLSAAAGNANEASRNGDKDQKQSGNIEAAASYQEIARMQWSASQAWSGHAAMLDKIAAASDALSISGLQSKQDDANEAQLKATQATKTAFEQAKSALEKVNARGAVSQQIDSLKSDLQSSIDALSGDE